MLYKEKATQLFEHKRKPILLDDEGRNFHVLGPPNSFLYVIFRTIKLAWRRKNHKAPSTELQKKRVEISMGQPVTVLAEGGALHLSVCK